MPEKFKVLYEQHKKHYLKTYGDSYLRHPRNVVRKLDTLYEKCAEQLENADPDKVRQLVPTMLKIIQTLKSTIDAIPFDQLENEQDEFETVMIGQYLHWTMATPDPLDEEDEQKLRELLQTEAPFEKIRNFIEYLRCKNQDILVVTPLNDNGIQEYVRGRKFELLAPGDEGYEEERQANTSHFMKEVDTYIR